MPKKKKVTYDVDENGCWVCTSHKPGKRGYPLISRKGYGVGMNISRYIYMKENDVDLDSDQHVLHTCDNPLCINPDHLYVGDRFSNMADRVKRNPESYNGGRNEGSKSLTI